MNGTMVRIAGVGALAVLLPLGVAAQTGADPNGMGAGAGNSMGGAAPVQPQTGPGNPNGVPPASMRESLGAPGQTGMQMQDRQFLMKAARGGVAEVQLGMLAAQKGGPEVKEFGQKMVDDHTAMNKDMGAIADQMGVMLPKKMNKEDQQEYDKLAGLSGDAFDSEYIAFMVKDHRQDMHEFRMEATMASNENLQTEVVKAAGVIRQHLQMIVKLAEEKGVPVPPRPPRPGASAPPPPAGQ